MVGREAKNDVRKFDVFFQRLGRDLKQIIENVYTCTVCLCV
jgi:hypothetical protein